MLFYAAVIEGIAVGSLYGLLAFSIVLLYKATGVANFAQGSLGTASAFVLYVISVELGLPMYLAIPLSLVGGAALGAACYLFVLRPVDSSDHLNLTIRTLALHLLIGGVLNVLFENGRPYNLPRLVPSGSAFEIGHGSVRWLSLATIATAVVLIALFMYFFRSTRLGLQFEGLAADPQVAALLGVKTRQLTLVGWAISAVVALIVAVLFAPTVLLSSTMLDSFILFAFSAAAIGGLTSLPGALAGGLAIGVVSTVVRLYSGPEATTATVFLMLLFVLMFRPNGLFGHEKVERF